jgi:hypothetical protein
MIELIAAYKEIAVALIAVFGVVLPYWLTKNKELNLRIASRKRHAYTKFLDNFTDTAIAAMHDVEVPQEDADRNRILARNQLLLFGSDDVVKAYDAWIRHVEKMEEKAEKEKHDYQRKEDELVKSLFLAIRKDVLGKTKVTAEHLETLNPYTWG